MPADGSNSAHRMNGDFGTSPFNGGRRSDKSAAYLSPMGAATDIGDTAGLMSQMGLGRVKTALREDVD